MGMRVTGFIDLCVLLNSVFILLLIYDDSVVKVHFNADFNDYFFY